MKLKDFRENDASRFLYYSKMKIIKTTKKYPNNKKVSLNETELFKASEMIGTIALSKHIPDYSDEINLQLCEKVTKSKKIMRWQEFNYLYLFKAGSCNKSGKAKDSIIPYQYMIDLSEWDSVSFLDCNKMAVQISKNKKSFIYIFKNIIEAQRFYFFSQKAKMNMLEKYKMRNFDIRINVDWCLLYAGQLTDLERFFKAITNEIYERGGAVDETQTFKNFSNTFNSFMIAFIGKTDFPARFMGLFIKIYQNFFFERVTEIVVWGRLKETSIILKLINDIKFHETLLKRWNIFDLRLSASISTLEAIYTKKYFNENSASLIQNFLNLTNPDYFFYKDEKKISYIMIDLFNNIRNLLLKIKNIRRDKDFKLSLIMFVRRCITVVLTNMKFISEDEGIKLPLECFPMYINSFSEFQERLDGFLKFFSQTYKIGKKYLNHFFYRKNLKKRFKEIQTKTIDLYQHLLVKDIVVYFKELETLEYFNIREYFEKHVEKKLEISNQFIQKFINLSEYASIYSTVNNFLLFLSERYGDDVDEFNYDMFVKKSAELQGKLGALKLNDGMIKMGIIKILRSLDKFFKDKQNYYMLSYNISFGFNFDKNFDKMIGIVKIRNFDSKETQKKIYNFMYDSTRKLKQYENSANTMGQVHRNIRVITLVKKFIEIIKYRHKVATGDIVEDDSDEEPPQKPADTKPMTISMRYFCYKKTTKQNYGYIKYK